VTDSPSSADVRWFRSAVDWWLAVILVVLPFTQVWALLSALRSGESESVVATAFGCALVAAIYGLLVFPMRYGIAGEQLIIRFGVVRRRIRLADIREVYPTHNPLSSPALSLDRLAIRTGNGMTGISLVSPSNRSEFLETRASRAGLVSEGDRLVRGPDSEGSVSGRGR